MERKNFIAAVSLLGLLLIDLLVFSIKVMDEYPHKIRGLYYDLDAGESRLDDINLTELELKFNNNNNFTSKYNASEFHEHENGLYRIIPNNNEDIEIIMAEFEGDIFFYGNVAYEVRFPGGDDDYGKAQEVTHDEMEKFIEILDLNVSADDIEFGDNDFTQMDDDINELLYIGLLTLIIVWSFMIIYNKGKIIEVALWDVSNIDLGGVGMMLIGAFMTFDMIYIFINHLTMNVCGSLCLITGIILVISGFYLIRKELRKAEAVERLKAAYETREKENSKESAGGDMLKPRT